MQFGSIFVAKDEMPVVHRRSEAAIFIVTIGYLDEAITLVDAAVIGALIIRSGTAESDAIADRVGCRWLSLTPLLAELRVC